MQAKLLRVLEEGEVERIGGNKAIPVDVRILVATHRDLEALVRKGTFRQDLFHRVHVFPILLPPLRDRREDIAPLIDHFTRQVCAQNGWKAVRFTPDAVTRLRDYAWPGNIRELRNMVERLLLLATDTVDRGIVELALPSPAAARENRANGQTGVLAERVAGFERETILAEIELNHWHITNTAKALGLERSYLYKKCQQLGIDLRRIQPSDPV
jgi:DNA-binding NtrC family response regulator